MNQHVTVEYNTSTHIAAKLKTLFQRHLLVYALVILCSVPLVTPRAALADCKEGESCAIPAEIGKQAQTSRVNVRTVPANTEKRRIASEVILVNDPSDTRWDKQVQADGFLTGKHLLSAAERTQIAAIAAQISQKNVYKIQILGHADIQAIDPRSDLPYKTNKELSKARAKEAGKYLYNRLSDQSIPISIAGAGDKKPLVSCEQYKNDRTQYRACLGKNRRVEFRIWYYKETASCNHPAADSGKGLRISVDGVPIESNDAPNSADSSRCADVALQRANIQLRFDPLKEEPALNITATPNVAIRGEAVAFTPYSNYTHFVKKAELRLFANHASSQSVPLEVIPVPLSLDQTIQWDVPREADISRISYVLRVYDAHGRFDETQPKLLELQHVSNPMHTTENVEREQNVGYGENHLAIQNIRISGGMVTVNGSDLAPNSRVTVWGRSVPVDTQGQFAYRQIMPVGYHIVPIVTYSPDGRKTELSRAVEIVDTDWFYTGFADITVGKNHVDGPAGTVTGDDSDRYKGDTYAQGRLAFYMKGNLKDNWELTSSADTQEQPLEDLFTDFTSKDPRYLLKRIDPNDHYAVFGDDSTTIEDAPTQGKFFLKLANEESQLMWGNFKTEITGTDLLNHTRSLYGANIRYKSTDTTTYGEKETEVEAYAADPGSIQSIEEYRGTGGSLYYLRGQDVAVGSEQLRLETRDRNSGIVLSTQPLTYGQDYEINYLQGRVILREALASNSSTSTIVQTGSLAGNPQYLVAIYEYTPSVTEIENLSKGGRISHWFNDHLRVGATAYDQEGEGLDQTLSGYDLTLRYKPGTYLKLEKARSEGAGNGGLSSTNGGFDFDTIEQTDTTGIVSDAYRAEVAVDISEVTNGTHSGTISAYGIQREDGFSAPGQLTNEDVTQYGAEVNLPIGEKTSVSAKADIVSGSESGDDISAEISATHQITTENSVSVALRHEDRETNINSGESVLLSETGKRLDLALKILHEPRNEQGEKIHYDVYGLIQGTVDHDASRNRNDRIGAGGRYDINDSVSLTGEATVGEGSWGSQVGVDYRASDRTSYYANYLHDSDRSDTGYRSRSNNVTLGSKTRYSDSVSVFSENRYENHDTGESGLIHAFGLDLAASDAWTWSGRFENGRLASASSGDTDRIAVSLTAGYVEDNTKYSGTAEYRTEENSIDGDRNSWFFRNNLSYQTSDDWRLLGDFDIAISHSGLNSDLDANFIEAGIGYAYRPVLNDRFNGLFKYRYVQNDSSPGQLSANGTDYASTFEQRSHVLSADGIYDIMPKLSFGAKLGYRFGELRDTEVEDSDFFDSQAYLAVARLDWHVVKEWDIITEARYLAVDEAEDDKFGLLVGVYRHVTSNFKLGVGYNFTDFSDDLTDLDYNSQGFFINAIGKF